jgi:serine/threonine protein phosphatase PrpC
VLLSFFVKAPGESHIEKGDPCQDAAGACSGLNKTVGIACVADGHGGAKYFRSGKGAELAVRNSYTPISNLFCNISKEIGNISEKDFKRYMQEKLKQLESDIIRNWRNEVYKDLRQSPFTKDEKEKCNSNNINPADAPENLMFIYGTTLLAGLVSDKFWFAIQIGDGLCVIIDNDNKIFCPIPEDERLAFGRTTSLSESNALENFRESFGRGAIQGLTVATDGISDSFEPDKYLDFNRVLYDTFSRYPSGMVEDELNKKLLPDITKRGSRDDVSMAGIFRQKVSQNG